MNDSILNGAKMGERALRIRTATLYIILMAMVATTLAMVSAGQADAFPGANGLVVYDDGSDVLTSNADGTNPEVLIEEGRAPSVSANGLLVAYTDTSSSDFLIYTVPTAGGAKTQVTTGGSDFDPAISPDGTWIAFRRIVSYTSTQTTNNAVPSATEITETDVTPLASLVGLTINNTTTGESATITGFSATTITTTAITDDWNADDEYTIDHQQDRIYKIMANGTGEVALSTAGEDDYYSDYAPDWSPDGTKIAFATKRNGADDVYVMDAADGGSPTNLTETELNVAWDPSWSPDGSKIAYSSANNGAGGDSAENIWTMNADGSGRAIVLSSGNSAKDEHPTWSPDGTTIAFERLAGVDVTVQTVPAGGGSATLLAAATAQSPDWQATVGGVNDTGYNVDEGATLVVAEGPGVLTNDLFPDSSPGTRSAVKVTDPAHGEVTLNANGSFTYVHDDTDTVSDSFTYYPVQDGVIGSTATVSISINPIDEPPKHLTGLVDPTQGLWYLYNDAGLLDTSFYFGNPGDFPFMGDWNCDGTETPGMYRQSDGYVYLRNTNTVGPGDIRFFFGNPGDVPVAGDFNNDGCDTVSIYRPSNQTFYIINELGEDDGGLGEADFFYVFGNPGDKPFVGDFDGDGVETVGLHRESTGLVYFRNSHTQGNADAQFIFGDPGDRLIAGDWNDDGNFSPALFRPSNTTMYFRYTNTQGNADNEFVPSGAQSGWLPVSGVR
ncbi:MAG: Ig-like domain-containing protein [Acidimicrobiia bacterium]